MTLKRTLLVSVFTLWAALVLGQSWTAAYEKGLQAARAAKWADARAAFQQAIALRPEDFSGATTLPGPVSEQRRWRGGAPYSPNFLSAYSEYRLAMASATPDEAKPLFETAASEFEALLAKGQNSRETFYFLNQIYNRLGDTAKRQDLEARFAQAKPNFRVDTEVVDPVELTAITGAPGKTTNSGGGPTITVVKPGQAPTVIPGAGVVPGGVAPAVGPVGIVPTKYALVIGNSTTKLSQDPVTYGAEDAQAIREALVTHAGYAEANVDLVLNASKEQILASVKALSDRLPADGATVFVFFAGNGSNIAGKDYLAGVDSENLTDPASMVAKGDVFREFMAKGAHIFAFFEVPRPTVDGVYFGKEVPLVGAIAQVQSTIPGAGVYSITKNGHTIGLFADAMVTTFQEIRSNRIPITEFGWQVFSRIRGGGTGHAGGGGPQIPTLPVLTHLGPDDKF